MSEIMVMGAGAFGGAMAVALAQGGHAVRLWARDPAQVALMAATQRHAGLDVPLPAGLAPTDDPAPKDAQAVLLCVPMQALAAFLDEHGAALAGRDVVACCKGLDLATGRGPAEIVAAAGARPAVLTGPSFAAEIARGLPTALTLAAPDGAEALQGRLATRALRLYRTDDVAGAQIGGALKNVVAIACGAAIGAGLGESCRAALMTRGMAETVRLAVALGARPATLMGLSGMGDLALTCGSDLSRNFRYGRSLATKADWDPSTTVEGAATARAVLPVAEAHGVDMPVASVVAALVEGETDLAGAVRALLDRPLRDDA